MDLIIMDIVEDTVVDGPGFRTSVYAAGCRHHCLGCHNPQSWNFDNGYRVKVEQVAEQLLADPFSNVTFSGGDPLEQVEAFTELAKLIKMQSKKTVWCYTGYRFEYICQSHRLSRILPYIDVLVDGRYMQKLQNIELLFRGSSNQRLVDVEASLQLGKTILINYEPLPIEVV